MTIAAAKAKDPETLVRARTAGVQGPARRVAAYRSQGLGFRVGVERV